jgi:hypothetical protein
VTSSATAFPARETANSIPVCTPVAITQIRHDTPGRAYYQRKRTAGKSHREALRCLKRRLSDAVYRRLMREAHSDTATGSGKTPGGDYPLLRGGLNPYHRLSGQDLDAVAAAGVEILGWWLVRGAGLIAPC